MKTVAFCIPVNWDYVPIPFFGSFLRMMGYAQGKYHILSYIARASSVNHMRTEATEKALDAGADYILHLDVDEVYPEDTPERLMKHIDDGKEVVGGLYISRINDTRSAFEFINDRGTTRPLPIEPNTGLQKVDSMGFGGIMTSVEVFDKIEKPWFFGVIGHCEDVAFCHKCKKAGVQVWVDTDLQYGHLVLEPKYP